MTSWEDLRLALAVARAGGLKGAAALLAVDPSTVFRRLAALEQGLGVRLFDREGAYRPTAAGERLAQAAERIEAEAAALDRELTGVDQRLTGRLRVTCSETMAFRLLPAQLAAFRRAHPGILLELVVDNRQLSLARREADVALRTSRPEEGHLWGRRLAGIAWAAYASSTYLDGRAGPSDAELAGHELIGWEEGSAPVRAAAWLAGQVPKERLVYRSNSLINQHAAARAGLGVAVLPCYLADPDPELPRLMPPIEALTGELWIVTHVDLKATARVRAFMTLVGEGLRATRDLLEGRASSAAV